MIILDFSLKHRIDMHVAAMASLQNTNDYCLCCSQDLLYRSESENGLQKPNDYEN